ncbi:MAG: hypothetical protein M3Z66_08645 [Chloroflexota bacterium]|nr:hypothetical protein [Chloroflexota bacterium]
MLKMVELTHAELDLVAGGTSYGNETAVAFVSQSNYAAVAIGNNNSISGSEDGSLVAIGNIDTVVVAQVNINTGAVSAST